MASAKYLLRFDDICPTMEWSIWEDVEKIMDQYHICPIIAVVPDNKDPMLICDVERKDYWDILRKWQMKGWKIALHGYQHSYENKNCGILKVNDYSEFAGLSEEEQNNKIKAGLEILHSHGIECDLWIAPAHSFDTTTIKCLRNNHICVISDGYADEVFIRYGAIWIPCQLYKFIPKDFGIWTVCKHPNMWNTDDLEEFRKEIHEWHEKIVSLGDVLIEGIDEEESVRQWEISEKRCQRIWHKRKMKNLVNRLAGGKQMIKKAIIAALKLVRGDSLKLSRKKGVKIGENCRLNGMPRWGSEPWLVTLENHVEISNQVTFITHDGATWCFRDEEKYKDVIRYGKIQIKDNCFIGANTTILPGVTIGPNSIVGAASVVTKDVLPNSVYAGAPARRVCSLEEYAEKCLKQTPGYDKDAYGSDKKKEVLRILGGD